MIKKFSMLNEKLVSGRLVIDSNTETNLTHVNNLIRSKESVFKRVAIDYAKETGIDLDQHFTIDWNTLSQTHKGVENEIGNDFDFNVINLGGGVHTIKTKL